MRERKDGIETRKRILEAACNVFSKKGFRAATISEICKLAGSNIASVNYHFGDKETLYVEAWRQAFLRSIDAHPPDGGVPSNASAEERLRGRILALIQRIVDPKSYEFDIVHKELANPTGLLTEAMRKTIGPIQQGLTGIIEELLGDKASEHDIQLCEMSIKAQCLHPMIHKRRRHLSHKDSPIPINALSKLDDEIIANHITRFCLAGIREKRRQIESGEISNLVQHK